MSIIPFSRSQKETRVPFVEVPMGAKFRYGVLVCMKISEFLCRGSVIVLGANDYYKVNFVNLGINRGTLGFVAPGELVEVVPPREEDFI
ncbi:MAG: hypothetical protein WC095_02020 [Candidatus Paceibacterota bacterium]